MKFLTIAFLLSVTVLGCDHIDPGEKPPATEFGSSLPTDRDSSAINVRNRDSTAKTPLEQDENKIDIGITASIRKSVGGSDMSLNSRNVMIVTQDGTVTLRGPVKSQQEKFRIDEIARGVAGVKNVENFLEVESNP